MVSAGGSRTLRASHTAKAGVPLTPTLPYPTMKLHLDDNENLFRVTAYDEISVTVGERRITRSFVIMPTELVTEFTFPAVPDLSWDAIAALHDHGLEILVLGTGRRQVFPSPHFYSELARARIGLEVMDSAAACRTYNILAAEGRRVAALIMLG